MLREFHARPAVFDELADMAAADSDFSRIAYDFVHPNWSLPEEDRPEALAGARWNRYRDLFRQLDLGSGVTIYEDGEIIVLERSSSGFITSGRSKQFLRAGRLPDAITLLQGEDRLACDPRETGWCSVAKHIDGDWYMVLERH